MPHRCSLFPTPINVAPTFRLADRNALIASLKSELAQLLSQRDQELENAKKFAAQKVAEARVMWENHGAQKLAEVRENPDGLHASTCS